MEDVLSAYKQLHDRKMHEDKQSSILSYFKPSTSATADDGPQHLTLRQAVTEEGEDISDLLALTDSNNGEMLIGDPLPLSPTSPSPHAPTTASHISA